MAPRRSRRRQLRGESRRQPIDEAGRQIQGRNAEEDTVDAEQRAQVPVHGATAGVRELMQSALRFQKTQRLCKIR